MFDIFFTAFFTFDTVRFLSCDFSKQIKITKRNRLTAASAVLVSKSQFKNEI